MSSGDQSAFPSDHNPVLDHGNQFRPGLTKHEYLSMLSWSSGTFTKPEEAIKHADQFFKVWDELQPTQENT